MSEARGYDIGIPETIRLMVEKNPTNSRGVSFVVQCKVKPHEIEDFIKLASAGYLLRTDFNKQYNPLSDSNGKDQLEGELKRYWARKNSIQNPNEVIINPEIIKDYCNTFHLNEFGKRFSEKLN
jgi:hypothetical protein